jgi:hypothetical protein
MSDDKRMHHSENDTPGLVAGRGHEHHEEPLDGMTEGSRSPAPADGDSGDADMRDRHQPSALGGETATRSGA